MFEVAVALALTYAIIVGVRKGAHKEGIHGVMVFVILFGITPASLMRCSLDRIKIMNVKFLWLKRLWPFKSFTTTVNTDKTTDLSEDLRSRARSLEESGMSHSQAHSTAWLEERIKRWPTGWGDDLEVLIFGDFRSLETQLILPDLRIVVHPGNLESTVIKHAMTVHKATVGVDGKDVASLIDAAGRINAFLGIFMLVEWGNSSCGWWSWVTHDTSGSIMTDLAHKELPKALEGYLALPEEVRKRIDAALYWIREPNRELMISYRSDVLRTFTAYWNAFECLVEAVSQLHPKPKERTAARQTALDKILEECGGTVSHNFVQRAYTEVTNPGFVGKATNALRKCFGVMADFYVKESFLLTEKENRLYDIRNSINHGDVDAENLSELLRIQSRLSTLMTMIWGMFAFLIPFPAPINSDALASVD